MHEDVGTGTALRYLWAKTAGGDDDGWHPLILHVLDVAASAQAILLREPESTRARIAATIGLDWEQARPWILLVVACHDLGKASPGFQHKWPRLVDRLGLKTRRSVDTDINHAFVSQIALSGQLRESAWPVPLAVLVADAVGCHHGERASPTVLERLEYNERGFGGEDWIRARRRIFGELLSVFEPLSLPVKQTLTGPDFMLLAGLTSFADWIGSNTAYFPFGMPAECEDLHAWFEQSGRKAAAALDAIGWSPRAPLTSRRRQFEDVFGFPPRPLQRAMAQVVDELAAPALIVIEAPMGEGKTEAAFFAHLELQRRFGHRGMYVALPTRATGNAMFSRTLKFLHDHSADRWLDCQLLHGASLLNDEFQSLRLTSIHDPQPRGHVRASEWFTHKKRALLSEYGVGTADQAIVPILPVRHNFVRLWGLANRVVVFDEVHAYDAYTGTLLMHLLSWLLALGSSVVLLSATLPPVVRRRLSKATATKLPDCEVPYPRISVFAAGQVLQKSFASDATRRLSVRLLAIGPELGVMKAQLEGQITNGGMALVLLNTVQRAQDFYRLFPQGTAITCDGAPVGKRLDDGTEVLLFHARYPAEQRQMRENHALTEFGTSGTRQGRKILVATQVAEQSLDLDFDVLVTDLAPVDLLLQRAGRLWRHQRAGRAVAQPTLLVAGLAGELPVSFAQPLWWDAMYREDILLRTWCLFHGREQLILPDEVDESVQAVYEQCGQIPEDLRMRLEQAEIKAEGELAAHRNQANQAIVGFPDDQSWNEPGRFVLRDEDDTGLHRSLLAKTRLGEDSVVAIPMVASAGFDPNSVPSAVEAKRLYGRAVSLSRQRVVRALRSQGVPRGWTTSPLLRNAFPMVLASDGCWGSDASVRLDEELGIVYGAAQLQ